MPVGVVDQAKRRNRVVEALEASDVQRRMAVHGLADKIRRQNEARTIVRAEELAHAEEPIPWLTLAGLEALAAPDPLIEGWLNRNSLARINGPSGVGKSFLALDMALSVASGLSWHGVPVKRAVVAYVLAEGGSGMAARVRAWQMAYPGADVLNFQPVNGAVQVGGPSWRRFIRECADRGAGLVILDTQARVTVGVEENSNSELGAVVAALDALREATGACVLLVHHTGKIGDDGRGASVVKAALDTELSVGKGIEIRVTKQKDGPAPAAKTFVLRDVPGSGSVVPRDVNDRTALDGSPFVDPMETAHHKGERRALVLVAILRDVFAEGPGATRPEVRLHYLKKLPTYDVERDTSTDAVRLSFDSAWNRLHDAGRLVRQQGERFKYAERDDLGPLDPTPEAIADKARESEAKRRDELSEPLPTKRRRSRD